MSEKTQTMNHPEISTAQAEHAIRLPVRDLISEVVDTISAADVNTPTAEHPVARVHQLDPLNPAAIPVVSKGDDIIIAKYVAAGTGTSYREQLKIIDEAVDKYDESGGPERTPAESLYAKNRSTTSGLKGALEAWSHISGVLDGATSWEESNFVRQHSYATNNGYMADAFLQPFNQVLYTEQGADHPEARFSDMVIPAHEAADNGYILAEAAAHAIERLVELSEVPEVRAMLASLDYNEVPIARAQYFSATVRNAQTEWEQQFAAIRMLNEAVTTVAQVTSMLVGGLPEVNLKEAMESLNRNGVYKLLATMLPGGVIGPMAMNGFRFNPELVLDQAKLAQGEYTLDSTFRAALIADRAKFKLSPDYVEEVTQVKEQMAATAANGVSIAKIRDIPPPFVHTDLKSLTLGYGCPAKARDIAYVAQLVAREIPEGQRSVE